MKTEKTESIQPNTPLSFFNLPRHTHTHSVSYPKEKRMQRVQILVTHMTLHLHLGIGFSFSFHPASATFVATYPTIRHAPNTITRTNASGKHATILSNS